MIKDGAADLWKVVEQREKGFEHPGGSAGGGDKVKPESGLDFPFKRIFVICDFTGFEFEDSFTQNAGFDKFQRGKAADNSLNLGFYLFPVKSAVFNLSDIGL